MQRESLKFAPRLRRLFPLRSLGLAPSVSLPLRSAAERFVSLRFETRTRTERSNARIARPMLSVPPATQTASKTVFRRTTTTTNVRLLRNFAAPSARFQPFVRRISLRVCSRLLEGNGQRERERDSTNDKIIGATRAKKGRGQILSVARSPFSVERSVQERIPAETCFRLPDAAAIRAQVLRSCGLEAGPFASIGSYRPARSRRGALLTLKPSLPASFTDPLQSLRSFAPFGDANPPPRLFRSTSCSEARCDRRTEWRVRTRFARSIFCVSAGWTRLGGARVRADVSVDGYR